MVSSSATCRVIRFPASTPTTALGPFIRPAVLTASSLFYPTPSSIFVLRVPFRSSAIDPPYYYPATPSRKSGTVEFCCNRLRTHARTIIPTRLCADAVSASVHRRLTLILYLYVNTHNHSSVQFAGRSSHLSSGPKYEKWVIRRRELVVLFLKGHVHGDWRHTGYFSPRIALLAEFGYLYIPARGGHAERCFAQYLVLGLHVLSSTRFFYILFSFNYSFCSVLPFYLFLSPILSRTLSFR